MSTGDCNWPTFQQESYDDRRVHNVFSFSVESTDQCRILGKTKLTGEDDEDEDISIEVLVRDSQAAPTLLVCTRTWFCPLQQV